MSRYSPATLPLRRLIELAVTPGLKLAMVPLGDNPVPVHAMPVHFVPELHRPNRHEIAPSVDVACPAPDEDLSPYSPYPRYRVVAKDTRGVTWVSLNSPTEDIPPPPDRHSGPMDCSCVNLDGIRVPRYGDVQLEMWHFCPTWFDEARPGLPFIPDLFCGAGPCIKRDYTGFLHQWDEAWVVDAGDGYMTIKADVAYMLQEHDTIDQSVLRALGLRPAAASCSPPGKAFSAEELKQHWDRFVAVTLERRGRALERLARDNYWVTIREQQPTVWRDIQWAGYYDYVPLGVWVRDTPSRVKKIRQLLEKGVPVYYMWREDFSRIEELAPLAPNFIQTSGAPPLAS